jgi:hypothetical protein
VEAHAPPGDEGIDCGVAAVFCCSSSCGQEGEPDGDGWSQEYVFVQRDSLRG